MKEFIANNWLATIYIVVITISWLVLYAMYFRVSRKNKSHYDLKLCKFELEPRENDNLMNIIYKGKVVKSVSFTDADIHTGNLILVNSTYGYDFEANAAVENLVNIRENQSYPYQVEKPEYEISADVLPMLDAMIAACDAAMGTTETGITSAHRSLEYQQNVWDETAMNYGEDYAAQYVAVPGYSEHHTGKACDIGIFYADGSQGSFSESRNAVWMRENCGRFGFIRRYAEDKTEITGISNEAWHFRYVGFPHAAYMMENNLCLEEYLEYLRNNTSEASPLVIKGNTGSFKVYYTTERTIAKPSGSYTVSGDNMEGFIITVTA